METTRLQFLMQQFAADRLSEPELEELQSLLEVPDQDQLIRVLDAWIDQESDQAVGVSRETVITTFNRVIEVDKENNTPNISRRPVHRINFMRRWGWAAAAVLLIGFAGVFYLLKNTIHTDTAHNTVQPGPADVPPGKNGAVLTLADGRQVVLDSLGKGLITSQNGTKVILDEGRLSYDATGSNKGGMIYNTVSTPKGRQFQITLPDGTKVWLNAASSIHYPTQFTGDQRLVAITGEVYFEVTKNARMPFKVNIDERCEVEVLGTHFNIKAYKDESVIKTTLLEGKVKVGNRSLPGTGAIGSNQSAVLKPGEQAIATDHSPLTIDHSPDLDNVMAWKNGLFNFEGMQLREVMQQLERWYDIEVVYEGKVPDVKFYGELSRGLNLSGIINALKDSGIRFRIDGNRLIVLP
ncbi:FecR family protein [Niastella yeongjuensis]|nr:FecR family protein [Niastella yeongjuensis]